MDSEKEKTFNIPHNVSNILYYYLKSLDKYTLSRIKEQNLDDCKSTDEGTRMGAEEILKHNIHKQNVERKNYRRPQNDKF